MNILKQTIVRQVFSLFHVFYHLLTKLIKYSGEMTSDTILSSTFDDIIIVIWYLVLNICSFWSLLYRRSCQQTERLEPWQVANWKSGMLVWSPASQGLGGGLAVIKKPFLAPWLALTGPGPLIYTDLVFNNSNCSDSDGAIHHIISWKLNFFKGFR